MNYTVLLSPQAEKQLDKLSAGEYERIDAAIARLATNPRPHGCKKLKNSGEYWRVRVGHYRIVYEIQDQELVVLVVRVMHRKDVYR